MDRPLAKRAWAVHVADLFDVWVVGAFCVRCMRLDRD